MEIKTFFAQDAQGNALSLASVTVRVAGTATIADIFDEAGAAKENPFQATASGAIVFAAANGSYDVNVQWNGGIAARDIYGVQFFDPAEAAGSQFATAAQGAKADTAVQPARSVSAGTGLTGGGDLTANRTISASIATQAEAEAGTVTSKLMTPQRTKQAITARIGVDVQAYDPDTLKADVADQLTAAFTASVDDDGARSSGTYTPSLSAGSNYKKIVNGGAFTLSPPALGANEAATLSLFITNNASAGAITTTGFTRVTGDSFTITNGDDFLCRIEVYDIGGVEYSLLNVVALQ